MVPLYWLATTLVLALAFARPGLLGAGTEGPGYLVASYLFWPMARTDGAVQPLYSLGWTLNYEMAFYALFALALPLGRRGAVLGVLALLAGLVLIGQLPGPWPVPLAFWSDPIVLEFACGAGLALARQEGLRLPGPPVSRSPSRGSPSIAGRRGARPPPLPRLGRARLAPRRGCRARAGGRGGTPAPAGHRPGRRVLCPLSGSSLRRTGRAHRRRGDGLAALIGPGILAVLMLVLASLAAILLHRTVERPLTRAARAVLEPARTPRPAVN